MDASGYMQYSPANDFSWLDLGAVGDYVANDQMTANNANLLLNSGNFQPTGMFVDQQQQGVQWQQLNNTGNWQFDLNGNLLF